MPPWAYWRLFRLSPLIMLVGMTAGAWFIFRAILVWGVGGEYSFAWDIPVTAVILALWVASATVLLRPPSAVLAHRAGPFTGPVLVWALGRRFRGWNILAVPLCGVLAVLAPLTIPVALGWSPGVPASPWLGLPIAIGLTVFAAAMIWICLRSTLHGVELTPTHLIARGYLGTSRYARTTIVSVNAVELTGWHSMLLTMLLNRDVGDTVQLSLDSGEEPLLLASNSHSGDVESGAEIIRAWRLAGQ